MRENRGPWYLLTGLVLGAIIGVLYVWFVHPVEYINTTPRSLRSDFKDKYRALIALAYLSNGSVVRAKVRLDLLGDADIYAVLAQQAQRTLAEGDSASRSARPGHPGSGFGAGAANPRRPDGRPDRQPNRRTDV